MLSETAKNAQLEERLHISDLQISMQRELYDSLRSSIEETRRLRHDFRHHLAALRGYTANGDCHGADQYLDHFLNTLRTEESYCDNYAVDAIVRHYAKSAKEKGVRVEAAILLSHTLPVAESDVCVILGNLLENAVEACARQDEGTRFLIAKAGIVGLNMIAITVRNSYSGEIRRLGEAFLSSKRPGEGIGIASVRVIASRYQGTVKLEYHDHIFSASVFLNP